MTGVEVATGEIVAYPTTVERMTPAQAADWAGWVRELMRSVLVEGQDYGVIPGTGTKPTMYKSGGEMLLRAAGLGFANDRLDDDAARDRQGISYRCTVYRPDGSITATCDGYCGRDETSKRNANWNTIIKIAQKRAMVGAALNATASSGLFNADLDDDPPPAVAAPFGMKVPADDPEVSKDDRDTLRAAIGALPANAVDWLTAIAKADTVQVDGRPYVGVPNIDGPKFRRSHRDRLAWHLLAAQRIAPQPDATADYHARVQAMRAEKHAAEASMKAFVADDQRGQDER